MLLQCTSLCKYIFQNSVFSNNVAGTNGGVVEYDFYRPDDSNNNTYTNNQAQYGHNIAAYPMMMNFDTQNSSRRMLGLVSIPQIYGIYDGIAYKLNYPLVSGTVINETFMVELLDNNRVVINTDNSS